MRYGRWLIFISRACVAALLLACSLVSVHTARPTSAAPAALQLVAANIESPTAITLDPHGNLYAVVYGRCGLYDSIVELSPQGTVVERLEFTYGTALGQFKGITGVAVDSTGNIYATDFLNNRVQKLSPAGRPLAVWTGNTNGAPGIHHPTGLTLDQHGNLYVVDSNASRVVELAPNGKVIGGLSTGYAPEFPGGPQDVVNLVGLGPALTQGATGISVRRNVLYVTTGDAIRKLSLTGALLAVWKPALGNTGYKLEPSQIAVAPDGNLFVSGGAEPPPSHSSNGTIEIVDIDLAGIVELSPRGAELTSWTRSGWQPGRFIGPTGIATDAAGNVYVADESSDRIQKLAGDGTPLAIWGDTRTAAPPHSRFGQNLDQLAVAPSGRLYALSVGPERLYTVSPHGSIVAVTKTTAPGVPFSAAGLAADHTGNVYLADRHDSGVVEIDPHGRVLHHWKLPPARHPIRIGKFTLGHQVQDVAVGPPGSIYAVVDNSLWLLSRATGRWRTLVAGSNSTNARFGLSAIAVDPRGRVYAIDGRRIDVFSLIGKLRGTRSATEVCAGDRFTPDGLAVGPGGNLFVADGSPAQRILKFSPSGRLLGQFGRRGDGPGQFEFIVGAGIAVGRRGTIFVGDSTGRIQKFSPAGKLLAVWR